jgi:amicyanin
MQKSTAVNFRVLAALIALMALVVMNGNANAADAQVKIANFTFEPPVLTVKVGTTVTWVNDDDIPHLVSEKDGKFRSSALDTDATFSQTFKDAGTIEYFCVLHPHMTGKIVVEP